MPVPGLRRPTGARARITGAGGDQHHRVVADASSDKRRSRAATSKDARRLAWLSRTQHARQPGRSAPSRRQQPGHVHPTVIRGRQQGRHQTGTVSLRRAGQITATRQQPWVASKSRNAVVAPAGQRSATRRANARRCSAARGSRLPCATSDDRLCCARRHTCRPHSVFSNMAHRPARGSSPGFILAGARPATHRAVALIQQFVDRDVVALDVGGHVPSVHRAIGLTLTLPRRRVEVHHTASLPGPGLVPTRAGTPGVVAGQRPLQRLHLAHAQHWSGRRVEQPRAVGAVLLTHRLPGRIDSTRTGIVGLRPVTYPQGLRKMQAGVEEHHVHARVPPGKPCGPARRPPSSW